jgi:GMP synthase-like glutamine amidotransferase
MKPLVVVRHALTEGAGYLGDFLTEKQIPWQMIRIDQGDPLPSDIADFSGMVLMGGPMSVNDDLPWIAPLVGLIQDAIKRDIPLLGHCLGGQLISKALGATVGRNPVKEVGWGQVDVTPGAVARQWFGDLGTFNAFHWHGETFGLPTGAVHLLSSPYCRNQAYAIGKHLSLQCHIEMTEEMVKVWCDNGQEEIRESVASPGVQTVEEIQRDLPTRVAALNPVSHRVYEHWIRGLAG